jgi:uncharacterized HAD superfamily protein
MKSIRPIIAIDVDDVLAGENETMREFINQTYGLNLTPEDYLIEAPYHGYWAKVWGVTEQEGRKRYEAYLDSGAKENHLPIKGSVEAIAKLEKDHDLVIVTSRYDFLIDMTRKWLEENFPKTFKQIEFVPLWSRNERVSKAVVCKKIGATYLVDDSIEHCNMAAEVGIKTLLFGDYGWNREVKLHPAAVRAKDWDAVLEYFDEQS